jgi:hypothetical protein
MLFLRTCRADHCPFEHAFLGRVANRYYIEAAINGARGINRVTYRARTPKQYLAISTSSSTRSEPDPTAAGVAAYTAHAFGQTEEAARAMEPEEAAVIE